MQNQNMAAFYRNHLEEQILPFWDRAADQEYGGVFTGFSNQGDRLVSTDKYTWSQGRYLWLMAHLAEASLRQLIHRPADFFVRQADRTADLLLRYALLDDGNCAFLLSKQGHPKEPVPGSGLATSIYADFNILLGLAEYSRVFQRADVFDRAFTLYHSILEQVAAGTFRCEPYPLPRGFRSHGITMMLLHGSEQLLRAAYRLSRPEVRSLTKDCRTYLHDVMNVFRQSDGTLVEILGQGEESMLTRHCAPGHMLECAWFVWHAAELLGEGKNWLASVLQTVLQAYCLGWDDKYGGIYRFVDTRGGQPSGPVAGQSMEALIMSTWSLKLWWVHSEALYATYLAYQVSGWQEFLSLYEKTRDYTFRVFPHPDPGVGDWIQVQERDGRPLEAVTSVPGKDPFHIARSLLLIIERASQQTD